VIIISSLDAPKSIRETEKNPKNPLVRVKKPQKTQKKPKKPQKTQKNPGFFQPCYIEPWKLTMEAWRLKDKMESWSF
jgi:hypothetical protein